MLCYLAYPTSLTLQSANALQTYTTLRELRQRRPDTLAIIARWHSGESRFADVGALHLPRPAVGRLSRLYRSSLWYYLEYSLFAWMCAPIIAAKGVQAIYVRQNICAAWWSSVLGPRLGIPVIYEAHDLEMHNPSRAKEAWAQGVVHLIDHAALTRSQAVVSLTHAFRDYLATIGWRSPQDVAVVPDAYDDTIFVPQDRTVCRRAAGLPEDALIIGYAGMTFSHRWLEGLLEAVANLLPTYPNLLLLLAGGRPAERAAIEQHAEMLNLHNHLIVEPPQPQQAVVQLLGAADVLVIPDTVTDMTASPLKLFECLALGQPLVLPDMAALREIVLPEQAHYFPRRSMQGLTAALHDAIQARGEQQQILARRHIAQEHTYGHRAERILSVVDRVTKDKVLGR
jgi:glycosyltransferase involved in cell wall biosynthesis